MSCSVLFFVESFLPLLLNPLPMLFQKGSKLAVRKVKRHRHHYIPLRMNADILVLDLFSHDM